MLCSQALCRQGRAGQAAGTGTEEGEEDGWGSLGPGCHLLKEGELLGGEFPEARLRVVFEIFESFRREGTSQSEVTPQPDPGRRGGMLLGVGRAGRTAQALSPLPCRPGGGFLSPAPPLTAPHAWEPASGGVSEGPLTGAQSGRQGVDGGGAAYCSAAASCRRHVAPGTRPGGGSRWCNLRDRRRSTLARGWGPCLLRGAQTHLRSSKAPSPTTVPLLPVGPELQVQWCGRWARAWEGQGAQAGQAWGLPELRQPRSPMKSAAQVLMW